jgi:hypothetical protein
MRVYADVELTRKWFQAPVAMTMKVDCATMNSIPGSKGIMA